jgi:hypothetical protein
LVDEVVPKQQLMDAAQAFMQKQLKLPDLGRSAVKVGLLPE